MDLTLTDDQEALRDMLRDFLAKESPPAVVRAAEPLGFDEGLWRKTNELGLTSMAVAEERGGGGAGFIELALAAELIGRSLAPLPLIEASIANRLLASLVDDSVLGPLLAGEELATVALHPAVGDVARLVPAGAVADLVVVLRGEDLVLVRQQDRPEPSIPNLGAMPLADCTIPTDALVLASGAEAVAAQRRARRQWEALTAVALVGLAERALELGVEYVLSRRAFGMLIAEFQTIQHSLADDATDLEGARLLAYQAAWAHDVELAEADQMSTMALLFAAETAFKTASECLHFHGGYGYALEYDIQLYFRRAKAWPLVVGDPRRAYADLAWRLFGAKEA